jgi:hypothetical protein
MPDSLPINFSIEDLQIIDAALAEMPYRIAAPVIQRINQQFQDQSGNSEQPTPTPPTP